MTWQISDADEYRFTEGDCHVLARALARRIRGAKVCSFQWHDSDWPDLHCFVRLPDGRLCDVRGPMSERAFRALWDVSERWCIMQHPSPRAAARIWGQPVFGDYSYRRARQIADRLVEAFSL